MVIEIVVVVVAAKLVMSFVERLGVRAARVTLFSPCGIASGSILLLPTG